MSRSVNDNPDIKHYSYSRILGTPGPHWRPPGLPSLNWSTHDVQAAGDDGQCTAPCAARGPGAGHASHCREPGTLTGIPGATKVTIRVGRNPAQVAPEGNGPVLEKRECAQPVDVGDRLTLSDGTEVVVIGVVDNIRPGESWEQIVHVGNVF